MTRKWFKIGEAARLIGASPKELRYWETQIPEIKPRRSKGNLRYYHLDEIPRLHRIHAWISEGLTVSDCRELLLTGQLAKGLHEAMGLEVPQASAARGPSSRRSRKSGAVQAASPSGTVAALLPEAALEAILAALKRLHQRLSQPPDFLP